MEAPAASALEHGRLRVRFSTRVSLWKRCTVVGTVFRSDAEKHAIAVPSSGPSVSERVLKQALRGVVPNTWVSSAWSSPGSIG